MPKDPTDTGPPSTVTRWLILVVSLGVTASSFSFINGVAFLIPALESKRATPLAQAGLLSSMPTWGMVVTLIPWGYALDRVGERIVMTAGSALTAAAAYAAASVHSQVSFAVFLFLGGMAAASCNSAGGRLVSGWFRRTIAGWRWESVRPRNRWGLPWALWSSPRWPKAARMRE